MQYERSEHFALQASELTALPFPNRGVVSLTDRKIFLPHRDQQSHFHIRPVRGLDLAAGFLANFTFIFLTYVACSGLHLWPRRESVSLNLQPMRENHRTSWDELVAIIIMFFLDTNSVFCVCHLWFEECGKLKSKLWYGWAIASLFPRNARETLRLTSLSVVWLSGVMWLAEVNYRQV